MSATAHTTQQEDRSIWKPLNAIFGGLVALLATYWGVLLLIGALKLSFIGKTEPVTPPPASPTAAAAPVAAGAAEASEVLEITIKPAGAAGMEFDVKAFSSKAGQKIKLTLENTHPIPQPHNFVLGKVGTKDKIMMAAMQMAASPDGMAKGYIPEGDDVLAHTKLLQPTQSEAIEFTAPAEAGQYPYLCTFPGHGMLMNGILTVE